MIGHHYFQGRQRAWECVKGVSLDKVIEKTLLEGALSVDARKNRSQKRGRS
jgi:hypothetical protein